MRTLKELPFCTYVFAFVLCVHSAEVGLGCTVARDQHKSEKTLVFNIKANSELCNPQKHPITNELPDGTNCPSFIEETHVLVSDLRWRLNEIRRKLQNNTEKLSEFLGADKQFSPCEIKDDQSVLNKSLKRKNKPQRIVLRSLNKFLIIQSYLQVAIEMLQAHLPSYVHNTQTLLNDMNRVARKLFEYAYMLNVSNIDTNICDYNKSLEFFEKRDVLDYTLSIFNHSRVQMDAVYNDILSLESKGITKSCKYVCSNYNISLKCERRGRQSRRKMAKGKKRRQNKAKKFGERKKERKVNSRKNRKEHLVKKIRHHKNKQNTDNYLE